MHCDLATLPRPHPPSTTSPIHPPERVRAHSPNLPHSAHHTPARIAAQQHLPRIFRTASEISVDAAAASRGAVLIVLVPLLRRQDGIRIPRDGPRRRGAGRGERPQQTAGDVAGFHVLRLREQVVLLSGKMKYFCIFWILSLHSTSDGRVQIVPQPVSKSLQNPRYTVHDLIPPR